MAAVSDGMDVARVREIAQSMLGLSHRLGSVKGQGDSQVTTLERVWSGPDAEKFSSEWHKTSPTVQDAESAL